MSQCLIRSHISASCARLADSCQNRRMSPLWSRPNSRATLLSILDQRSAPHHGWGGSLGLFGRHCVKQLVTALPHVTGSPSFGRALKLKLAIEVSLESESASSSSSSLPCALTFPPPPSPSHSTNCSRKLNSRQSSMSLKCVFRMGSWLVSLEAIDTSEVTLGRMKLWRKREPTRKAECFGFASGSYTEIASCRDSVRRDSVRRDVPRDPNQESALGAPLLEATEKMENRERRRPCAAASPLNSGPPESAASSSDVAMTFWGAHNPPWLWPVPSLCVAPGRLLGNILKMIS